MAKQKYYYVVCSREMAMILGATSTIPTVVERDDIFLLVMPNDFLPPGLLWHVDPDALRME